MTSTAKPTHQQQKTDPTSFELSQTFIKYIKDLQQRHLHSSSTSEGHIFDDFLRAEQHASPQELSAVQSARKGYTEESDLEALLNYFSSPEADLVAPAYDNDLNWPLSSYFVSSSHNTYLTGNVSGRPLECVIGIGAMGWETGNGHVICETDVESSVEGYKTVLLKGCRCVEVDVWNGKPPEEQGNESDAESKKGGLRQKLGLRRSSSKSSVSPKGTPERKGSLRAKLGLKKSKDKGIAEKKDDAGSTSTTAPKQEDPKGESYQMPAPWTAGGKPASQAEPRVLHGYTLTKEVTFRKVCEAIRDAAFLKSDLPVIVSLEVHCDHNQQAVMVDIIKSAWDGFLVQMPSARHKIHDHGELGQHPSLPTPDELRKKILIKVKYSPPRKTGEKTAEKTQSLVDSSLSSSDEEVVVEGEKRKRKKQVQKIIDELSDLGVYTRSFHFKNFEQPEASIPSHVFSLGEAKLIDAHQNHALPLFKHNKKYFMRAYPKGIRVSSSNLNPLPFWRYGVQMVALNWQNEDKSVMLNEGMFTGTGGWVLKPPGYRAVKSHKTSEEDKAEPTSAANAAAASETVENDVKDEQSKPKGKQQNIKTTSGHYDDDNVTTLPDHDRAASKMLDLTIELLAAQNLPLPSGHHSDRSYKPHLKAILHTERLSHDESDEEDGNGTGESKKNTRHDRAVSNVSVASYHSAKSEHDEFHSPLVGKQSSPTFGQGNKKETHQSTSKAEAKETEPTSTTSKLMKRMSGKPHKPPAHSASAPREQVSVPKPKLKARSPTVHGRSPDFEGAVLKFQDVEIPGGEEALCFLRIKVIDDVEMRKDELTGWVCVRLDRLRCGYRILTVWEAGSGERGEGRILVKVSKRFRGRGVGSGTGGKGLGLEVPVR
ncbi:MAG: hypothetical protein M1831_000615 [Alyxoria varia]|nr:MAG: hypothetical protein M1831_000615 [Alyxoria varia]